MTNRKPCAAWNGWNTNAAKHGRKATPPDGKTRNATSRHTPQKTHTRSRQMKKILENMIIKWHQAGYALDEIAPLVPQVPKAEIAAIIHQCDKENVE